MTPAPIWPEFLALGSLSRRLAEVGENVLGGVAFAGQPVDLPPLECPLFTLPMRQCGEEPVVELWLGRGPISYGSRDGIHFAKNQDVLFGMLLEEDSVDGVLESLANDAYRRVLDLVVSDGFPHFLRMWNHFPAINAETAGLERYRQFCIGRHQAFAVRQYNFDNDLPAASAVGTSDAGLAVYFIASRSPGLQVENRRQLSAFRYPVRYGPRSPSFSRAILKEWEGERQLYISGTASIVDHETLHAGDLGAQLDETLRNLEVVLQSAIGREHTLGGLDKESLVKVYLRYAEDWSSVRTAVEGAVGSASLLCVQGDLCRSDLLLEIEAVIRV
jgi:chorismate lyase / 3-hydroxybenzoate synthase